MKKRFLMLLLFFGLLFPVIAEAAIIEISWSPGPEPDIAGYYIYIADTSEEVCGAVPIDAGNVAVYRVTGLEESVGTIIVKQYFFRVTVYDTSGNESGFSSEASCVMSDRTAPSPPTSFTAIEVSE